MKNIKKLFFILPLLLVAPMGCTDLDDVLYDRIPAEAYVADPILKMSPIYAQMRDFLDWGGWWFAQEITGDLVTAPTRGGDWDDGGKWRVLHRHTWDNNTEAVNSMWSRFYIGALEANKFIEEMEGILAETPEEGRPVIQEAIAKGRVLRAYYYYLLIDNYGDVPYGTSFLGAPERPRRNFRAEIFDEVVREIEESVEYIQPSISKTGVNLGMVYSLLTKLYLNHAVYTGTVDPAYWVKAEEAAEQVIQLNMYSLEADALGPFVTSNQTSPENIWTIPYDENNYEGFNLHMRTLHYNSNRTFNMIAAPWNGFAVMEAHFNSYEDNDRRRDGFLVGQQYAYDGTPLVDVGAGGIPLVFDPHIPALHMGAGHTPAQIRNSGARVVKFEIKRGADANLSNHFPIFRYADVLLMKAEALIRQHGPGAGDQYVNMVRERAGVDPWNSVDLDMLLEERGREMFWEGHRRQDLIRFGKFNDSWWEKDASTPDRNTFPIPEWAEEANPALLDPPVSIESE